MLLKRLHHLGRVTYHWKQHATIYVGANYIAKMHLLQTIVKMSAKNWAYGFNYACFSTCNWLDSDLKFFYSTTSSDKVDGTHVTELLTINSNTSKKYRYTSEMRTQLSKYFSGENILKNCNLWYTNETSGATDEPSRSWMKLDQLLLAVELPCQERFPTWQQSADSRRSLCSPYHTTF